jgi:hypothetical protein
MRSRTARHAIATFLGTDAERIPTLILMVRIPTLILIVRVPTQMLMVGDGSVKLEFYLILVRMNEAIPSGTDEVKLIQMKRRLNTIITTIDINSPQAASPTPTDL